METANSTQDRLAIKPTSRRPLLGITVLLVEDSRFCSEAVRLLCFRSGARLRRADSLAAARRHLKTYRPAVVLVDIGLPDGSGLQLIEELANLKPNAPVLLATSGEDPDLCQLAAASTGADGFLTKPLKNLTYFQSSILKFAAGADVENVINLRADVDPDQLAMREDLIYVRSLLARALTANDHGILTYCAQFLRSVADVEKDGELLEASCLLSERLSAGLRGNNLGDLTIGLIDGRLKTLKPV